MKYHSSYPIARMKSSVVTNILDGKVSVTSAARTLKVSRQAIYKWITKYREQGIEGLVPGKTGPKCGTAWNRTPPETEAFIISLMEKNRDKSIYDLAEMLPKEHKVHPCTIFRIYQRQYRLSIPKRMARRKPQLYIKEKPGDEIQMDTSFPWGRGAKIVSFDCIDDRSRFAMARLYDSKEQSNAVAFLSEVIKKAPFHIRAIRTDCGREFGYSFDIACKKAGIRHIRNDPYSPAQNGKVEKFHDIYKQKCFYTHLSPYSSIDEQNYAVWQFLTWYNHKKPHWGLGMDRKTPIVVLYECLLAQGVNLTLQQNNSGR